ncbi:5-nucleotidase SurE [hydrothermal vent metagenome]|uniref:5'-nucleotidase n=1 Tax=hydrothermal vent metagenome TaxID=652676 RepID=A0A1W1BVK1_9ZZZZ
MNSKYKILVTNDDGYDAKGLEALRKALCELEDVEVIVVAPANEKSACGHSLTLTKPLRFVGLEENFFKLEDGTPTDCVYLSLSVIFQEHKPDLVVSGINRGSNMGEDITYSGTASAAMEGVLHGVASIAISQVMDFNTPNEDYSLACETIKKIVTKIRNNAFPLGEREFLNINIPPEVKEAEMKITYAGYRIYANDAEVHRNPRGEEHYWLGLHPLNFQARSGSRGVSDYEAIRDGYISITPIMLDLTAYKSMQKLEDWLL